MANKPKTPPKGWLWSDEAAGYIGVSVTTLYRWRRDGIGPKSVRHGRRAYRYKITDLTAWLNGESVDSEPVSSAA